MDYKPYIKTLKSLISNTTYLKARVLLREALEVTIIDHRNDQLRQKRSTIAPLRSNQTTRIRNLQRITRKECRIIRLRNADLAAGYCSQGLPEDSLRIYFRDKPQHPEVSSTSSRTNHVLFYCQFSFGSNLFVGFKNYIIL